MQMDRISVAVPRTCVADVAQNTKEICKMVSAAEEDEYNLLVLPELCLTGATCGDLFRHDALAEAVEMGILQIAKATENHDICVIFGAPRRVDGQLLNCAVVMHCGCELGYAAKAVGHEQARWFASGKGQGVFEIPMSGGTCRVCVSFGYEMPAVEADVFVCLDASPTIVGAYAKRQDAVCQASLRVNVPVAYVNAGFGESTTDAVYGGEGFVFRNGTLLAETEALSVSAQFAGCTIPSEVSASEAAVDISDYNDFLPNDERCGDALREVLQIQTLGLAKRFLHTRAQRLVLGVSGGLDSTLAMIVCVLTTRVLGLSASDILAVTMPGYGTSSRTYQNAQKLMNLLNVESREISIKAACEQHFDDIGHDRRPDLTFENAQARERTQILLDLAGMQNGLVVGTGDMTELALGFATYNGDHMSSYGVNAGVPKTVVRAAVRYAAECGLFDAAVGHVLLDIADTPISPELLPPLETGDISQKTEEIVGPYDLNDFFLYQTLTHAVAPREILTRAAKAFDGVYDCAYITEQLNAFNRRFFTQQFKRSCIPDGPQVFGVSLSPRGGFVMPSDAVGTGWQL